jgi:DNA helicase II / ATP-dependent DNA helicase PcrA
VGAGLSNSRNFLQLAKLLEWLYNASHQPIDQLLRQLCDRLGYEKYLLQTSAFEEIGEGKVRSVQAFIVFSQRHQTMLELVRAIIRFERRYKNHQNADPDDTLQILSMHRAKGLEWEVVFVPDLNDGIVPFAPSPERLEEERRLLYVALTRAKTHLHLLSCENAAISRFLEQANANAIIDQVRTMQKALHQPPLEWSSATALALVEGVKHLSFRRYFLHWWEAPYEVVSQVAQQAQRLLRKAKQLGLAPIEGEEEFWAGFDPLLPEDSLDVFRDLLPPPPPRAANTHTVGVRVRHNKFGEGTVLQVRGHGQGLEVLVQFSKEQKRLIHRFAKLELV